MNLLEQWRALEPYIISFGGLEKAATTVYIAALVLAAVVPRKWLPRVWYRLALAVFLVGAGLAAVYWEPIAIARQAKYLCENEAGMKVFRTVEARGFLGTSDIEHWSKYGFEYVENDVILRGKFRATMVPTTNPFKKEVRREKVESFDSEYEYTLEDVPFLPCCGGVRSVVRARSTGETLGQYTSIHIARSGFDKLLAPTVEVGPVRCYGPGRPSTKSDKSGQPTGLILEVIKPITDE